jgi:outer membrane lipoprotein SlyB
MRLLPMLTLLCIGAVAPGCVSQSGTKPTIVSSTQGTTLVQTGEVTEVRDVTVRGGRGSAAGSVIGSLAGGIAGSHIGGGHGRTLATIVGATAGGWAGDHAGKAGSGKPVTKVTVRTENGDAYTYDTEPGEPFRVGDRVKIVTEGGSTRIMH